MLSAEQPKILKQTRANECIVARDVFMCAWVLRVGQCAVVHVWIGCVSVSVTLCVSVRS